MADKRGKAVQSIEQKKWLIPLLVGALTLAINLAASWYHYAYYGTWNFDLAVFTQAQQGYSNLDSPLVSLLGAEPVNVLGNHFSPLLLLLTPLFALFPHAMTLNVVQAFCFAGGAFLLARHVSSWSSPLAFTLGLGAGLSFGFLDASNAQFHEYALAIPFLTLALLKLVDHRYLASALWSIPLIFLKEDMGFILIGLGVAIALRARSWRWLGLSALGALSTLITVYLTIPFFAGEYRLGLDANLQFGNIFDDWGNRSVTLAALVLTAGFVGLLSPLTLTVIPLLLVRLLSDSYSYSWIGYQYMTIPALVLVIALYDYLLRNASQEARRPLHVPPVILASLPLLVSILLALIPGIHGSTWLNRDYDYNAERAQAINNALAVIPDNGTLAADDGVINQLVDSRGSSLRYARYWGSFDESPDCLLLTSDEITGPRGELIYTLEEALALGDEDYEELIANEYVNLHCKK